MRLRFLIPAIVVLAIAVFLDGWTTWFLLEVIGGWIESNLWAAGMIRDFGYPVMVFTIFIAKVGLVAIGGIIAHLIFNQGILGSTFTALGFATLHFYAAYMNYLLI